MIRETEIRADLSFLADGHVRGWMKRNRAEAIVMEALMRLHMLTAEQIKYQLIQHSSSYESMSLTVEGNPTVHLRTRECPGAARDGNIYLRDAYRQGQVVGVWRSPHDVRDWFEHALNEACGWAPVMDAVGS